MAGSFLDKLFGKKPAKDSPDPATATGGEGEQPPTPKLDADVHEKACQDTQAAMDRHWSGIGQVETDVIAYLIPPAFQGGPAWPTIRQAYRVVRRPGSIIIATDGMSDPYDDDSGENGFGMELFIETADIPAEFAGTSGNVADLKHSWAFEMLEHLAGMIARSGGIRDRLEEIGSMSSETPGVSESHAVAAQVPDRFKSADDSIGVLFGLPKPDFPDLVEDTPFRPVRLVPVVVITAAELEFVRAGGPDARHDLVERLAALPSGHRSDLKRDSVI